MLKKKKKQTHLLRKRTASNSQGANPMKEMFPGAQTNGMLQQFRQEFKEHKTTNKLLEQSNSRL